MNERLRHSLTSPVLRYGFGAVFVALVLVGSGREVVDGRAKLIFAAIAAGGFCVFAAKQRGGCIGVLVLAAMNGLPVINNSTAVASHIVLQDLAGLALIGTAIAWTIGGRAQRLTPLGRALSWCGFALLVWCVYIVGRTWAEGESPLLGAIRFGRDFLYFGALLTVLPRVRLSERDVHVLLGVLAAGVCLYAAGQIATVEGIANPTFLVHAAGSSALMGVTRLYAQMTDLVSAGVAFGIAAVALTRGRAQWRSIPITALLTGSLILQLTRARWIATIAGVAVATLWLALQSNRPIAVTLRRRLAVFLGLLAGTVVILVAVAPGVISAGPLFQRVLSIFSSVGSPTSTVAVRQHVANEMTALLPGHWLTGLGLVPPSVHFYPQFPSGSIRDPDLGVLNAVMTIGLIGAALIYLPLLVALVQCMRQARVKTRIGFAWLNFGGQIWIVGTVVSSITLVTLFSPSGLIMSAVILAVLSQPSVMGWGLPADPGIELDYLPALPPAVPV